MSGFFTSDNAAGVHPAVMARLASVNVGHARAYGDDPWTMELTERMREHFGPETECWPVALGTAANVLCLQAAMRPWHAVLCTDQAHLHESECNAPEKHTGGKVVVIPHDGQGKLTPAAVMPYLRNFGFVHATQPCVLSITQCTEYGTLYTAEEIQALATLAHDHGMYLHIDGARLANAAAALGLPFRAFTVDCGVDMLSFGGTKNGLMAAEAVLLFRPELGLHMAYHHKQGFQLLSKMRYVSAQLLAYLEDDLWLHNARHANEMAALLAQKLETLPGIQITRRVETNAVFCLMPKEVAARAQERIPFYTWEEQSGECRLMCSWNTTEADIDLLLTTLHELLS